MHDTETLVNFSIENASGYDIKLMVSNADFDNNLPCDTNLIIPKDGQFSYSIYFKGKTDDDKYIIPFGFSADTAIIIFDGSLKKIIYVKNISSSRNILLLKNYTGGKSRETRMVDLYEYFYKITEDDYNTANDQ